MILRGYIAEVNDKTFFVMFNERSLLAEFSRDVIKKDTQHLISEGIYVVWRFNKHKSQVVLDKSVWTMADLTEVSKSMSEFDDVIKKFE